MSPKKDVNAEPVAPVMEEQPAKKEKPKKEKREEIYLPVFVELVFRFSGLFLILITLVVAAVSYLSGATPLQIVMRTAITITVMGILLIIITSKISSGALDAAMRQVEEAVNHPNGGSEMTGTAGAEKIGQDIKA